MQKEIKDSMFKWTVILGAIAVAAVLSSKVSNVNTSLPSKSDNVSFEDRGTPISPMTVQKPQVNVQSETKPFSTVIAENNETLFLFGEVDVKNSESLALEITRLNTEKSNKQPILLIIDSPGGSVFDGAKVVSALESSRRPVYTVCYGLCASMAAVIHQYGTKRMMVDRSVLMFHNASGGVSGEITKMLSHLNFVNTFVNKMEVYIAKRAGMTVEDYKNLTSSEIWIDSEDSYSRRFSDQTVILNLTALKKEKKDPFSEYQGRQRKQLLESFKNVNHR